MLRNLGTPNWVLALTNGWRLNCQRSWGRCRKDPDRTDNAIKNRWNPTIGRRADIFAHSDVCSTAPPALWHSLHDSGYCNSHLRTPLLPLLSLLPLLPLVVLIMLFAVTSKPLTRCCCSCWAAYFASLAYSSFTLVLSCCFCSSHCSYCLYCPPFDDAEFKKCAPVYSRSQCHHFVINMIFFTQ